MDINQAQEDKKKKLKIIKKSNEKKKNFFSINLQSAIDNANKFDILNFFNRSKHFVNLKQLSEEFWIQQTNSKKLFLLGKQILKSKKQIKNLIKENKIRNEKDEVQIEKSPERIQISWKLSLLRRKEESLYLGQKVMKEIFDLAKENMKEMYDKSVFNGIGWSDREKFKELTHSFANYLIVWEHNSCCSDNKFNRSINETKDEGRNENIKRKRSIATEERNLEENKKLYNKETKHYDEEKENIKHFDREEKMEIKCEKICKEVKNLKAANTQQNKNTKQDKLTKEEKENKEIQKIVNSQMVGYLHFRYEDDDEFRNENDEKKMIIYLWEFQIKKKHQRKGIGNYLISLLENTAKKLKIDRIICTVLKCNTNALIFYKEKCNFVRFVKKDEEDMAEHCYNYEILEKIIRV